MAYTKAGMQAVDKYIKKSYDSFVVRVPKGRKKEIDRYAQNEGESVNGIINGILRVKLGYTENEWKSKGL